MKCVFSEESLSQLKKLDNQAANRIIDRIEAACADPARFFQRLSGREEYKLRAGDYRVLARVFHNDNVVFILSPGHRKDIYKKR